MEFIKISVFTETAGLEAVTGRLYQLGVTGVEIEDESDFLEFIEQYRQYWDSIDEDLMKSKHLPTRVILYVQDNPAGAEQLERIRESMAELRAIEPEAFGSLTVAVESVKEEDWANQWKQYYFPIPIGDRILIKPAWQPLTEPTDRIVFENNPGASFGTGMHFSTQLCLEAIEERVKPGDRVLDIGSGSGILSITSLLLGAESAVALDIDPNAADVVRDNAALNHIEPQRLRTLTGDILCDPSLREELAKEKYPVVLSNIVADVIIPLAQYIPDWLAPDGCWISSGIIDLRVEDVLEEMKKQGFRVEELKRRGDWAMIACRR